MPSHCLAVNSCLSLFSEQLKGYLDFTSEDTIRFMNTDFSQTKFINKAIGRVEFTFHEHSQMLYISWIEVLPEFKERGLSTLLLNALLAEFPQTQTVTGYLTDQNYSIFMKEFEKTHDKNLALKETPFYKSLFKLGFSEIEESQHYDEKVIVALKKKTKTKSKI